MTKKTYHDTNTLIEVLLDIQDLVKDLRFTARNGQAYFAKHYPSPEEIRHKIDYRGLSEAYIFESIDFETPENNWQIDDPELICYFTGDASLGISISQDEDDPTHIHATHHIAYGGPNIWIDFILTFNSEIISEDFPIQKRKLHTPRITAQHLEKIEYGYAWWMNGAVIDITDDTVAHKIYEECFAGTITSHIEDAIHSGTIELPNAIPRPG